LIENYAGVFPLWLAPVQAILLPIADRHLDYARSVAGRLRRDSLRVEVDERREKIGYKIREAELQKIPYMLVVGDREAAEGKVSVRQHGMKDLGPRALDEFVTAALREVASKGRGEAAAA
jgi:threonyl-tRNA synthetase